MTVTPSSFRAEFPSFSDVTAYPDAQIQFWLTAAGNLLPSDRWDTLLDTGTALFAAHQLTIMKPGSSGAIVGPVNSKAVGPVSVGYDTSKITLDDAGHWNGSVYGLQFYQLARMMGAGGMQI